MHEAQRLINHVALVLDGSASMRGHTKKLVKVADEQIRHLALRSEELKQETRVSVYLFDDNVECLIFDMDVMRLPSIQDLYHTGGMTALIDATIRSQEDLSTTSQLYGDHAFLTFVLTDGAENASRNYTSLTMVKHIQNADVNWTLGFLVPDRMGQTYLERLGVSRGNIALWDTGSVDGLMDAAKTIRTATDNFMTARASGVRGTRSVFSTGADAVNRQTVSSTLTPLTPGAYRILPVQERGRIDETIQSHGINYSIGIGYYQLTKTETIQPQKNIIVVEKKTGKAYSGPEARHLIGLPDGQNVRVRPDYNPDYNIFVQSTSMNRILLPRTSVLVMR